MTASQLNKFKNIEMNVTENRKKPTGERVWGITQE